MHYEQTSPQILGEERWKAAAIEIMAVAGAVTLGAWTRVPLPFSPVPFTLQTLVVLLAATAVGHSRATAGLMVYVLLGLAGAPVLATPFGPTFGYLLAFLAVPTVVSRFRTPVWGFLAASLLIYGFGAVWLRFWLGCTFGTAFLVGVAPFLPGDAVKILAACRLAPWIRP